MNNFDYKKEREEIEVFTEKVRQSYHHFMICLVTSILLGLLSFLVAVWGDASDSNLGQATFFMTIGFALSQVLCYRMFWLKCKEAKMRNLLTEKRVDDLVALLVKPHHDEQVE